MEKISQRLDGGIQLKGRITFELSKNLSSKLSESPTAKILRHG